MCLLAAVDALYALFTPHPNRLVCIAHPCSSVCSDTDTSYNLDNSPCHPSYLRLPSNVSEILELLTGELPHTNFG
jgi:hypothetical protein